MTTMTAGDPAPSPSPSSPPPEPGPPDRGGAGPRALIHRMHSIAGVFVAPLLLLAALTGLGYAAAPTLEAVLHQQEFTAPSTLPDRPVAERIDAAARVHPDLPVTALRLPADSAETTRVLFADPGLGNPRARRAVFVDAGDLAVRGDAVQYGGSALVLRNWLGEGHGSLWLGAPGRLYAETAASWLGALTIGGLWLWWDRRRRARRRAAAGPRRAPRAESARATELRRHSRVGVWLAAGLLFLTFTGLTWSLVAGEAIGAVRGAFGWYAPTPAVVAGAPAAGHGHGAGRHAPAPDPAASRELAGQADRVVDRARREGLTGVLDVALPEAPGQAWRVTEARVPWRLSRDAVTVDGATGELVDRVDFADWPFPAKATEWLIGLHAGRLFGWVNQLALAGIAVGLIALILRGYRMWFLRGRDGRPGRLAPPSRWRALRPAPTAAVLLAILAYSALAPLFGLSLLLFLLLDGVWRVLRRRARRTGDGGGAPIAADKLRV